MFYSGNLNPYIYTYQNPIRYIDPNGKQVDVNFFNKTKDSQLYYGGTHIRNLQGNVLQISGHGDSNKGLVVGQDIYVGTNKRFNEVLSEKSSEWKNRKDPMIVILYACLLGKSKDGSNTSSLQDISIGSQDIFVGATKQVMMPKGVRKLLLEKKLMELEWLQ